MSKPIAYRNLPDLLTITDALADVLCWFRGYRAGNPDALIPDSLDVLRDLNLTIQDQANEVRDAAYQSLRSAHAGLSRRGVAPGEEERGAICSAMLKLTGEKFP